jgi:hypothetical protein
MGLACLPERPERRSRYSVHGIRLAVSTAARFFDALVPVPKHRVLP